MSLKFQITVDPQYISICWKIENLHYLNIYWIQRISRYLQLLKRWHKLIQFFCRTPSGRAMKATDYLKEYSPNEDPLTEEDDDGKGRKNL